ncbi:MAG TPA: low molecular weight phosphotyrosine protein phosphatase [Candidatus Ornithoclostridium excrementipullorum]|nr:low molecular weight phosphotyrosine protein phosphatase [Candidatus Ornithoclostridium excrementipullorum]
MQKKRVLFVCLGNICRSPMAEFIFRKAAEREGLADMFETASAGTSAEEEGNPVYPPAKAELARHGISCEGKRARKIKREDYGAFDAIVTMEERNSAAAKRFFGGDPDGKIRRLLDYTDRPRDIADPWWTGDFARTYSDIEEGTEALLKLLRDR